ncbi:MAG: hypothetical protein ACMUIP_04780, partial [bacterium]
MTDEHEIKSRFSIPHPEGGEYLNKPLIVHLAPLDSERVRCYAQGYGLSDPEAFIQALNEHHAWEWARRPLDVNGLIDYWREHGKLGSLVELIEHNLTLSLRESETRERNDPLTPEDARQGAEALAAAALLCRNLNFKVPDDAHIPDTAALDAAICLPSTWSAIQRRALLSRPLFDGATYGCIRFHHRRMMEYLATSWLNERMRDGCPLERLDDLLFEHYQEDYILRPALAPVAAWISIGDDPHNQHIRRRLLQIEPNIHLSYGDPAQLSIEYKRRVLKSLVHHYEGRQQVWLDHDPQALTRLADPMLAEDVSVYILNRNLAVDLRADMLLLVRYGQLTDCLEAAFKIIADPAEDESIKHYALVAMCDCADHDMRTKLAALANSLPSLSKRFAGLLCEVLYPYVIDAHALADILRKTGSPHGYSFELICKLKDHLKKTLTQDLAAPLLKAFYEMVSTTPHLKHGHNEVPISEDYAWLCEILPTVLCALLDQSDLRPDDVVLAAQCIRIVDNRWHYNSTNDRKEDQFLKSTVESHVAVKREYIWQGVTLFRADHQYEPKWPNQVVGSEHIIVPNFSDISWLTIDSRRKENTKDRILAFRFAFCLWQPYSTQWICWFGLLRAQLAHPELRGFFWKYTWQHLTAPTGRFWMHYVQWRLLSMRWWKHHEYKFHRIWHWIRDQCLFHRHLFRLYSGKAIQWLGYLSREAAGNPDSPRWAAEDWSKLRKKRGPLIAWATCHGCKTAWLSHTPLLPYEKPNPNDTSYATIVGLCGLQLLWREGEINFAALSEEDAERAARYALCEINCFSDWVPDLIHAQSHVVRRVMQACIQGE